MAPQKGQSFIILSLKSIFFKHWLFQVLQHLGMNLPLGSWWFFRAHKHHTYEHYSILCSMPGDLRHRSLGKPETYGDHINGDLLLRTCTSWAMWCCSTILTVWYRLKSQKSVYHAGVHLMYWEYRSVCRHPWVFLCWSCTRVCGTVEGKTSSLSPRRLTMLWKNAGESRALSVLMEWKSATCVTSISSGPAEMVGQGRDSD